MKHLLKIDSVYMLHILDGVKNFDVRLNDRDYQVGDKIKYQVNKDERYDWSDVWSYYENVLYKIIYIHSDFGMCEDYVVLGLEPILKSRGI